MDGFVFCLALAVVAGIGLGMTIEGVRRDRKSPADHAKCMAMVAEFVGDNFAASVLEEAAVYYGSGKGQAEQNRIVNTGIWQLGGPSVPELVLFERAKKLREG